MPQLPRRTRRRWLWGALVLLAILGLFACRNLGNWLVINEPLQKAQAIVVLSGQIPFRAMEGAALYRDGWAPELWLTRGDVTPEAQALARIGFDGEGGDHELSQLILIKLGVPASAIHVFPEHGANTVAEARLTASHAVRGVPVIIVTSKAHSRRVRVVWNSAVGSGYSAIVRSARDDPFESGRWWSTSSDVLSVAREVLGIVNAWLGFPIAPRKVVVAAGPAH